MTALVYHRPGQKAWEEVPDPRIIDPTYVIVAVAATICGTGLHILKGDVPAVADGRILGHDGVGTITEVGQAVSRLAVGDRVITSCGTCSHCHRQLPVTVHELGADPAVRTRHAHRVGIGGPVDTDVEQHLLRQRLRCFLRRHPRSPHRGSDDPTRRPIIGRSLTGAQRRRVPRLPVTRPRTERGAAGVTRAVKRRPPRAVSRRVPPTNTPPVLAAGSVDQ